MPTHARIHAWSGARECADLDLPHGWSANHRERLIYYIFVLKVVSLAGHEELVVRGTRDGEVEVDVVLDARTAGLHRSGHLLEGLANDHQIVVITHFGGQACGAGFDAHAKRTAAIDVGNTFDRRQTAYRFRQPNDIASCALPSSCVSKTPPCSLRPVFGPVF